MFGASFSNCWCKCNNQTQLQKLAEQQSQKEVERVTKLVRWCIVAAFCRRGHHDDHVCRQNQTSRGLPFLTFFPSLDDGSTLRFCNPLMSQNVRFCQQPPSIRRGRARAKVRGSACLAVFEAHFCTLKVQTQQSNMVFKSTGQQS